MALTALRALLANLVTQTGDRHTPALGVTALAELARHPASIAVALDDATDGVRTITTTVTGSDGQPLAGAPVRVIARAQLLLGSLQTTGVSGDLDFTDAEGARVAIDGRTDDAGQFAVRLVLAELALTGEVTARCGHLVDACDGA